MNALEEISDVANVESKRIKSHQAAPNLQISMNSYDERLSKTRSQTADRR